MYWLEFELNWIQILNLNSNVLIGIWIELNWIELNSNSTKFNSTIKLKFKWIEFKSIEKKNGMQIGGENIKNLLVTVVLTIFKKNLNTDSKRHLSSGIW